MAHAVLTARRSLQRADRPRAWAADPPTLSGYRRSATRAYKFLGRDGGTVISGMRWVLPAGAAPGEWVEAREVRPCRAGIHACHPADLAYWIYQELSEIELDGEISETHRKVVAKRGWLLRRITGWSGWAAGYNVVSIPLAAGALAWAGFTLPPAVRGGVDERVDDHRRPERPTSSAGCASRRRRPLLGERAGQPRLDAGPLDAHCGKDGPALASLVEHEREQHVLGADVASIIP